MANKKQYYKLDDVGFIGKQEKKSPSSESYHTKKSGEVFRQARSASSKQPKQYLKAKVS